MEGVITPVRVEELDFVWPHVQHFLQAAIDSSSEYQTHDVTDIKNACITKEFVLWVYVRDGQIKAALITEIRASPKLRFLNIPYIGGSPKELMGWLKPMLQIMDDYGRKNGCIAMTGGGRRGWCKAAGFRPFAECFVRDISNGR